MTHHGFVERCVGALLLLLSTAARGELPDHPSVSRGARPAWVQPVVFEPLHERKSGSADPSRVLLHDTQILVPATGTSQRYERFVHRLTHARDVEERSTISLDFDPSFQELRVHQVRVGRNGEWSDRIGGSRSSVIQPEALLELRIYNQTQSLILIVDDIQRGDVLEVEYTLVGSNPVFGDGWAGAVWLASQAISRRSVRVQAERPVEYSLHGGAPEPERDVAASGWRELVWTLEDVPEEESWLDVPSRHSPSPWIQLSTYASWQEVVDWALPLFEVPRDLNEIRAIASSLRGSNKEQLLVEARDWVQSSIRYFAVPIGEHSHRPHGPGQTLRRQYGDCKDKVLVLLALLRELDIEAWPVLVNASWRDGVSSFLPSPYAFDHVIVAARVNGEEVWLDPTLTHQGGSRSRDITVPHYGWGLRIAPGTSELTAMPEAQRQQGFQEIYHHYRLAADLGGYDVDIKSLRHGSDAEQLRRELDGVSTQELQERYLEYYSSEDHTITVRAPLELQDDREANRFEVFEHYTVIGNRDDGEWQFGTLDLELATDLAFAEDDRQAPLAVPFPLGRRETLLIDAPEGLTLFPVDESVSNEWLRFRVRSTKSASGRGITLDYALVTMADEVDVADFEAYNRDLERVGEALGYGLEGPVSYGDDSIFGVQPVAWTWAVGIGAIAGVGVLVFLVIARVADRRLIAHWLPSARPQRGLESTPGDEASSYREPSLRIFGAVSLVAIASISNLLTVPAGLVPARYAAGLFRLETFYYVATILCFIAAAILVILAQRRLLANLETFGLIRLHPGLAWSTWSWFVPIAFLFVPYRSFRQIGIGSCATADRQTVLRLVGSWWGFWLFSKLTGTWTVRVGSLFDDSRVPVEAVGLLASISEAVAGLLLGTLLLVLCSAQRSAARSAVRADALGRELAVTPEELSERLQQATKAES